MPRPKKDTEAGKLASARWRNTMLKQYGGEEEFHKAMQKRGHLGGQRGGKKGFASNLALARRAGSLGGKISRRGAGSTIDIRIRPLAKEISSLYNEGYSIAQIAVELDLPYSSLLKWAKRELRSYGQH